MSHLILVGFGYTIILVEFTSVAIIADAISIIIYDPPVLEQ